MKEKGEAADDWGKNESFPLKLAYSRISFSFYLKFSLCLCLYLSISVTVTLSVAGAVAITVSVSVSPCTSACLPVNISVTNI